MSEIITRLASRGYQASAVLCTNRRQSAAVYHRTPNVTGTSFVGTLLYEAW